MEDCLLEVAFLGVQFEPSLYADIAELNYCE